MDLELDHYDYSELLGLFELSSPYTKEQWKGAYSVVKRMHPDKSGLPGAYFDFFRRAHALLGSILQTRGVRTDVDDLLGVEERQKISGMTEEEFGTWFNQTFDEVCKTEDAGHGDWLAGDEGLVKTGSASDVHTYFRSERTKGSKRAELAVWDMGGAFDTMGAEPSSYSAPLFSSLQYDDVRMAHAQTFIPIDESDFSRAAHGETVEERVQTRGASIAMLGDHESRERLRQSQSADKGSSMARHYRLATQLERSKDAQKEIKGRLLALASGRT